MNNRIGQLLVAVGFMGGAYLASLDPETMDWAWFLPTIGLGAVGVTLVKRSTLAAARHDERLSSDRQILETSLDTIIARLGQLESNKAAIPTYEMRFEIDRQLRDDLDRFAEARDSMKILFGLHAYAEVMSCFAAGERYINRVWSASTDGYADEVLSYVAKSLDQFREARSVLQTVAAAA